MDGRDRLRGERFGGERFGVDRIGAERLGTDVCTDLLSIDGKVTRFAATRVPTRNTHGTGCTLSAAIAAVRPLQLTWSSAVADAKTYLTGALNAADQLDVGAGHGPVHHFHAVWVREHPHPLTEM